MSAGMETTRAMERANRSDWGKATGPDLLARLRLSCGWIGTFAALVFGAWGVAELTHGLGPVAAGLGAGFYGLLAGAWCVPAGELALGLALGASFRSSARVALRCLNGCAWIGAGMLGVMATAIAFPIVWGVEKARSRLRPQNDAWAIWSAADWMERGHLKIRELSMSRAAEFGPLAAWREARRLADHGGHDALRRAAACWRLSPFDPSWRVGPKEMISKVAGDGGMSDRGWIAWSRWARPPTGALLGDFWPDAGEMQAAVEAAILEREAGPGSAPISLALKAPKGRL